MFSEKKIALGKHQITYLDSGAKNDSLIPALFLHGWALSPQSFKHGLELISNHRRVIAPDLFSFKRPNNSLKPWRYEDYAEAICDLLDVLKIDKVHVIGHSFGGGILIVLSGLYPSKIQSLTLLDTAGIPLGSPWKVTGSRFIELPAQAWESKFSLFHLGMTYAFAKNLFFRTKITLDASKLASQIDLSEYMKTIRHSCLLIWGKEDILIPLKLGKEINAKISHSKLVIINRAYHEWSILMPEKFAKLVVDFVTSVDN